MRKQCGAAGRLEDNQLLWLPVGFLGGGGDVEVEGGRRRCIALLPCMSHSPFPLTRPSLARLVASLSQLTPVQR